MMPYRLCVGIDCRDRISGPQGPFGKRFAAITAMWRRKVLVHPGTLWSNWRPSVLRALVLCECLCPFRLARPATTSTATAKRELSLANAMRELDAGKRDGRVRERFESSHRRAASLDGAVVLLNEVVQILIRPNLHVAPARMLASQQPQRASTRQMAVERHFARHTRKCQPVGDIPTHAQLNDVGVKRALAVDSVTVNR